MLTTKCVGDPVLIANGVKPSEAVGAGPHYAWEDWLRSPVSEYRDQDASGLGAEIR